MTFAVLPFQPPAGDTTGAQVAAAMTDAAVSTQESRPHLAQVASRKSVEQAVARHAAAKDLASDLNVHFLIRGTVTPATPGYNVEVLMVDGATERVIDTKTLAVGNGALTPRLRYELEGAMASLNLQGYRSRSPACKRQAPRGARRAGPVVSRPGRLEREEGHAG